MARPKKEEVTKQSNSPLDKLTTEDLQTLAEKLAAIILPQVQKTVETPEVAKEPGPEKKKRGRPKKVVKAPTKAAEIVEDDDEEDDDEDDNVVSRAKTRVVKIKPMSPEGRKEGSRACHAAPLGKFKNKFEELGIHKKFRKDSAIDKKLWGENEPEGRDRASLCEINCKRCGVEKVVPIAMVFKNADTHEWEYVCDGCIKI
jgi:hypothetical protein